MPPNPKERLDKLLVERGLCATRSQAQALIMQGKVRLNGQKIDKPGTLVPVDVPAESLSADVGLRYVSRGGLKLEKALAVFPVKPAGRLAMDVGASTGGFTDCLLQNGASAVIAVDVGHSQFDWGLRHDARVWLLEKTNIRHLTVEQLQASPLPEVALPSLGVVDTSFISLKKVLPALSALLTPDAEIVALIKPQFEALDYIPQKGFDGVVRRLADHQAILTGVLSDLQTLLPDWSFEGLDVSPITGPKGNVEFLLHVARGAFQTETLAGAPLTQAVTRVLAQAHAPSRSTPESAV